MWRTVRRLSFSGRGVHGGLRWGGTVTQYQLQLTPTRATLSKWPASLASSFPVFRIMSRNVAISGQLLFAQKGDYALYRDLMAERCAANGVACWAYCFMPNHVHLILTPTREDGLARAVGEAHRRYTAYFNTRARVTGHLFQGRFSSAALDEAHVLAALRYLA